MSAAFVSKKKQRVRHCRRCAASRFAPNQSRSPHNSVARLVRYQKKCYKDCSMDKTNNRGLVFFLSLLFAMPSSAFAQVVITEIMYDPVGADTGREWIEVQNTGSEPVDLSRYRLFENATNHKVAGIIPAGAYGVIADNPTKFKTDWPSYAGLLFDSAFSLSNTGETFELRGASSTLGHSPTGEAVADSVSYSSGQGGSDGNSLNREGGSWVSRKPTPGEGVSSESLKKPAPPQPVKKTAPAKTSAVEEKSSPVEIVEDEPTDVPPSQLAAAEVPQKSNELLWWGAAFMLALSSAGAIVFARRFAKNEWDIVEGD